MKGFNVSAKRERLKKKADLNRSSITANLYLLPYLIILTKANPKVE